MNYHKNQYDGHKEDDDTSTAATVLTESSSEDGPIITSKSPKPNVHDFRHRMINTNSGLCHPALRPASIKRHDAPMRRRDIYFALDCEMVGVGPYGLDSALARVSVINWDNQIVLDTFVKVDEEVTDYRTYISGISPEHIESQYAMTLREVRKAVTHLLRGKILIGHGLDNDLKVLGIKHRGCDIRDTATYAPFMKHRAIINNGDCNDGKTYRLYPRKLKDLVKERLGMEIQTLGRAHSPIEDAISAMNLYKSVRSDWEMQMTSQIYRTQVQTRPTHLPPPLALPQRRRFVSTGSQLLFPLQNQHENRYPSHVPATPLSEMPRNDPRTMHWATNNTQYNETSVIHHQPQYHIPRPMTMTQTNISCW
jgi:RNA exonuclease 4